MLLLTRLCGTYGMGRQGVGVSEVRRVCVDSAMGRVIASRQARDGQDRQHALWSAGSLSLSLSLSLFSFFPLAAVAVAVQVQAGMQWTG